MNFSLTPSTGIASPAVSKTKSILCSRCGGAGDLGKCLACRDGQCSCACRGEHACHKCDGSGVVGCTECFATGHAGATELVTAHVFDSAGASVRRAVLLANATCWSGWPRFSAGGVIELHGQFDAQTIASLERAEFRHERGRWRHYVPGYKPSLSDEDRKRLRRQVQKELGDD